MTSTLAIFVSLLASPAVDAPGVALYRVRKFPQAERELRTTLSRQPQNAELRVWLARTLVELGRIPDALSELDRALKSAPTPEAELEAGRLLRKLAERRFQDLSRTAAGEAAVNEIAGRRLEREGNFGAALALYQDALRQEPDRAGLRYAIGAVHWKLGDLAAAEQNLRAELQRTSEHGMANFRLGQVLLSTNREADAIPYLERASTAMADRWEVRRELGKAYRKASRSADARTVWEAVAKARPGDDQVHFLLGGLYRELGDAAAARRELILHQQILEQRRLKR